ncbi:hypothetical protein B0T19DRAFT_39342 [Cercophora scortea]|uniref:Uncharacterized protein n=1 Tax=Cercophora scortea TaxID=314031 RepID=A0AAE0MLU4_9PEZI|nr:hypothetical protein B0T19DRAFT_39342 [Cercophora scortea]
MLANPATPPHLAVAPTMELDAIGIGHHHHHPLASQQQQHTRRKRKADVLPENNERLSKRLSLLNLEQGGTKLYVPVETQVQSTSPPTSLPTPNSARSSSRRRQRQTVQDDAMQLDDSKHKVYIYNLEDELSSESEPEDGKLVFLPDIEKHMRNHRILPSYMIPNKPDADLASKQLVLYQVPSSISIPEEQDSVRKAIIESRARMRERQKAVQAQEGLVVANSPAFVPSSLPTISEGLEGLSNVFPNGAAMSQELDDPDAMEID